MEFKDYYQTLGVPRDASADDIKKAFRRLARKYHPDVSKEADAEHQMKEVNEAYTVLSDPEKRAAYDQLGQRGSQAGSDFQPPPGWDANFNSADGSNGAQTADFSDFLRNCSAACGRCVATHHACAARIITQNHARPGRQLSRYHSQHFLHAET